MIIWVSSEITVSELMDSDSEMSDYSSVDDFKVSGVIISFTKS